MLSRGRIRLRVHERGAGETLACGTGACAAVVAGIRLGLLDAKVDVETRGGVLTIEWAGGDPVYSRPGRRSRSSRRNRTVSIQGITEADIANFLAHNPGFFERNAELLASIQLTSPHGQRAVSLQERQMEMLREKIKGLEGKIIEMIRHGQENVAIADRLHRWTRALMLTASAADLPGADARADAPVHDPAVGHPRLGRGRRSDRSPSPRR